MVKSDSMSELFWGFMAMEKTEKLLALLTLVLAVTIGISSWVGGVSDPGCITPM